MSPQCSHSQLPGEQQELLFFYRRRYFSKWGRWGQVLWHKSTVCVISQALFSLCVVVLITVFWKTHGSSAHQSSYRNCWCFAGHSSQGFGKNVAHVIFLLHLGNKDIWLCHTNGSFWPQISECRDGNFCSVLIFLMTWHYLLFKEAWSVFEDT